MIETLIVALVSLATFAALAAAVLGRWHDVNTHSSHSITHTRVHKSVTKYERERTAQPSRARQAAS
jgi:hypothetical protein